MDRRKSIGTEKVRDDKTTRVRLDIGGSDIPRAKQNDGETKHTERQTARRATDTL